MGAALTRRRFISGVIAAPVLAGLYAWRVESTWIDYVYRELPVVNLPPALEGKTLVQFSDTHLGPHVDREYMATVFAHIAKLEPDIVVHTGDIINHASLEAVDESRELLALFPHGKLGSFAILGNHDYGANWSEPMVAERIAQVLEHNGCSVLRNRTARVAGLKIIGMDDLWAGKFAPSPLLKALAPDEPAIVLSHNPDTCDLPGWENYHGWILSGHTHGGQCRIPFLPPLYLPVKNRRYTEGSFALPGDRHLYINRGVGNILHVRFNVRPEVTIFKLARASA